MSFVLPTTELMRRMDSLTSALVTMSRQAGNRQTRQEVCERLGIHRNTLASYMVDKGFPKPMRDGKWLLSEIVEWESER